MQTKYAHSFHIPVLGIAFTSDTALKTVPYGISSVLSLVDDILLEKVREVHSKKNSLPFQGISDKIDDFRAKRITAYLNLLEDLVQKKVEAMRETFNEKSSELKKYMEMLPDGSELRKEFDQFMDANTLKEKAQDWLKQHLPIGSIDVNIMTKVDKKNYRGDEALPIEYNDAQAALRGFAKSNVEASLILSAGMNPVLYGYLDKFEDFFPTIKAYIKKKVVLKVSDYRSALIQGKFLAKKGIWVSEYRVESGLNCGGHAFASDGFLMGPILDVFRHSKELLKNTQWEVLKKALALKNRLIPEECPSLRITAQGGVGTAEEHQMLVDHYGIDSVGWGTPFLNVPEVTTVDEETQAQLLDAGEDDLYLSDISPLGVPFNSLRNNSKDQEKEKRIATGRPGSPCPKKFIAMSTEFTDKGICTASRHYQKLKIDELDIKELPAAEYQSAFDKIVEKACICVGLGTPAYLNNDIDIKGIGPGVSICPGPNMAYFDKIVSLKEMTDHIYGRLNIISRKDRPHMFIKELGLYLDFLKDKIEDAQKNISEKQATYFEKFRKNLNEGMDYYKNLFVEFDQHFIEKKQDLLKELEKMERRLAEMLPLK